MTSIRIALSSLLVLATACPADPDEGSDADTNTDDDDDGTTGGSDPTATLTMPVTTDPTMPTTGSPTSDPSDPSDTDTDPTDPTDATDPTTDTDTDTNPTGEDSSSSTGDPPEATPATIYEIQGGDIDEDAFVEVADVIVTAVAEPGFFAQEEDSGAESGIWVYTAGNDPVPELGDVVTITAFYEEFNDLSQLDAAGVGGVMVTDTPGAANVPAPEPLELAEIGEQWEAVLVRVGEDTLDVVELSDVDGVEEFIVEDGNLDALWIDDFIYNVVESGDFASFGVGASFESIQGPLNYSFDEYKIAPRSSADLTGYSAP